MPYRTVKQYSDRGSLKDLVNIKTEELDAPTPFELRLKSIYEHALATRNSSLSDSVGFIVMNGSQDRSGYPVSIYRHREYINSLSAELQDKIEKTKQELLEYFKPPVDMPIEMKLSQVKQRDARQAILESGELLIKVAGANVSVTPKRSFRRVSK